MNLIVLFTLAASLIAAGDGEEASGTLVKCPCEKLDTLRAKLKDSQDNLLSCEKCKSHIALEEKGQYIAGCGCTPPQEDDQA